MAGFADATGRYLPLAATLNATLAVDRFAEWLGLTRDEAASSSGGVVVAPFLDGERTPNLPFATGTVVGLRHTTTPEEILRSVFEGVVVSLLDAVDRLGVADDAPVILIGGGARTRTWREVVRALSGRPVVVPEAEELVALGAAAQAASLVTGEAPEEVARRWDVRRGESLDAVPRDDETLDRHRTARTLLLAAHVRTAWQRLTLRCSVAPWFGPGSDRSWRSPSRAAGSRGSTWGCAASWRSGARARRAGRTRSRRRVPRACRC